MKPTYFCLVFAGIFIVSFFNNCSSPTAQAYEVVIVFPNFAEDSAAYNACSDDWAFDVYCNQDSVRYSGDAKNVISANCAANSVVLTEPLCASPDSIRWFSLKDSIQQYSGTWIPQDSLKHHLTDTVQGTFYKPQQTLPIPNFRSGDTVLVLFSSDTNSVYSCRRLLQAESLNLQDSASVYIRSIESLASLIQICETDSLTNLQQDSLRMWSISDWDSSGHALVKMRAWILSDSLSHESPSTLLHPLTPLPPSGWWTSTRTASALFPPFCQDFLPDSSGILPPSGESRGRWCWPEASMLPETTMIRIMLDLKINCLWQHSDRGIRDSTGHYQRVCLESSNVEYSWMPALDCSINVGQCPQLLPVFTIPHAP